MSSACNGDAIADRSDEEHAARESHETQPPSPREKRNELRISPPRSRKGQAPAPLGGERLRRSLKGYRVSSDTRLHNFPGRESFLPGRHFFEAGPPACPRHCPARAQPCWRALGLLRDMDLIPWSSSGWYTPANSLEPPAYVPASFVRRVRHQCTQACRAQSAQESPDANRYGRCGGVAASCVQVCRRAVFPECATARKRTPLKRLRQDFGRQHMPARYDG